MPFGHKAGLPPSKKYLLMRQPQMAFGLGIKSRFWLFGLGGESISGNKYDRKFAVKPISGRNSNQKLGINTKN